jgi:hypothetical protein
MYSLSSTSVSRILSLRTGQVSLKPCPRNISPHSALVISCLFLLIALVISYLFASMPLSYLFSFSSLPSSYPLSFSPFHSRHIFSLAPHSALVISPHFGLIISLVISLVISISSSLSRHLSSFRSPHLFSSVNQSFPSKQIKINIGNLLFLIFKHSLYGRSLCGSYLNGLFGWDHMDCWLC